MAISEELRIEITAQSKQAVNELKKVEGATGGIGKSLKGLAIGAAVIAGITVLAKGLKNVVNAASDAEETANKFAVTFSGLGTAAGDAAKELAAGYGLANEESQALMSNTADLLQGFGVTKDASLELSVRTQQLAADLASFANVEGGASAASDALTKGLLGEREAMKSLGIAITEAELKKFSEDLGYNYKEMTKAEKAAVTLELAYKQSANAIGDFARSQSSFANQMRIAEANAKNLAVTIGQSFLPVANVAVTLFNEMSGGLQNAAEQFHAFVTETENAKIIGEIAGYIAGAFNVLWTIVKQTFNFIIDAVKTVVGPLAELRIEGEKMTFVWDILGAAMQYIGAYTRVISIAIREQIETIIAFSKAAVASFNVIKAGVDRLKGDISKEEFRSIARDAGDAWADVGGEIIQNFTAPISQMKDEIVSFRDGAVNAAGEFESAFSNASDVVSGKVSGALVNSGIGSAPTSGGSAGASGPSQEEINAQKAAIDWLAEQELITIDAVAQARIAADAEAADARGKLALYSAETEAAELEAEQLRHDNRMANMQTEFDTYASYASGTQQIFTNLINSMMSGDAEMTDKRKKAVIALFRMQQIASIGEIAMNTASAIVEALPNIPLSIAVGAIGASQIVAAAAAKPPVKLAEGGIVMPSAGGTSAILGEAGQPEAVIPLDRLGGLGNITVHVHGSVGSQEDVATWVYEGIERARHMGKVA